MSATNVTEEYRWPGLAGDAFIVERCCFVAVARPPGAYECALAQRSSKADKALPLC